MENKNIYVLIEMDDSKEMNIWALETMGQAIQIKNEAVADMLNNYGIEDREDGEEYLSDEFNIEYKIIKCGLSSGLIGTKV